jgi:hypothetical protein
MGIPNIRGLNISLLSSCIRRFKLDEHKMWKDIMQFKYTTQHQNIFACTTVNASPYGEVHYGILLQQSSCISGWLGTSKILNSGKLNGLEALA